MPETKNPQPETFTGDWCRARDTCCDKQRGSASRYQMRAYALDVARAMHGASVCHCGAAISLTHGDVDRTATGCYRPGFVVMTCTPCNNDRTNVAEFDAAAFQRDVLAASIGIAVPKKSIAAILWKSFTDKGNSVKRSKYYRG